MTNAHAEMPGMLASQAEIAEWLSKTYPALHARAIKYLVGSYRKRGFTQPLEGFTATPLDIIAEQIERHPNHVPIIKQVNSRPEDYIQASIDDHGQFFLDNDEYRLTCNMGVKPVRAVGEPGLSPDTPRGAEVRKLLADQIIKSLHADTNELSIKQGYDHALVLSLTADDIHFGYRAGAYHDAWLSIPKLAGDRRHSLANCYDCSNGILKRLAKKVAAQFSEYRDLQEDPARVYPANYEYDPSDVEYIVKGYKDGNVFTASTEKRIKTKGTLLGLDVEFDWVASGTRELIQSHASYNLNDVLSCYGQENLTCEAWVPKAMAHQGDNPYDRARKILKRVVAKRRGEISRNWVDDIANEPGTIDIGHLLIEENVIKYEGRCHLADGVTIKANRISMRKYTLGESAMAGLVGKDVSIIIDHPFLAGYKIASVQSLLSQSMGPRLHITLEPRPIEINKGTT